MPLYRPLPTINLSFPRRSTRQWMHCCAWRTCCGRTKCTNLSCPLSIGECCLFMHLCLFIQFAICQSGTAHAREFERCIRRLQPVEFLFCQGDVFSNISFLFLMNSYLAVPYGHALRAPGFMDRRVVVIRLSQVFVWWDFLRVLIFRMNPQIWI